MEQAANDLIRRARLWLISSAIFVGTCCCAAPLIFVMSWVNAGFPSSSDAVFNAVRVGPNKEMAIELAAETILEVMAHIHECESDPGRVGESARVARMKFEKAVK